MTAYDRLDAEIRAVIPPEPPREHLPFRLEDLDRIRARARELATARSESVDGASDTLRSDRVIDASADQPAIPVTLYRPVESATERLPVLLWIHGGGLVAGVERDDKGLVPYCLGARCLVVSVGYRLAPEDPYPAGLQDCYRALTWVIENAEVLGVDPDRVCVGGASAGGGLAAATALLARDRGGPPLTLQMLIQPMIDDRAGHRAGPRRGWWDWDVQANDACWRAYLGDLHGASEVPPFAAPGRATDLQGLPDAYLEVGDTEIFHESAMDYARRLIAAGVRTELHVYPGTCHGWDFLAPEASVSQAAVSSRVHALRRAFRVPSWIEAGEGKLWPK